VARARLAGTGGRRERRLEGVDHTEDNGHRLHRDRQLDRDRPETELHRRVLHDEAHLLGVVLSAVVPPIVKIPAVWHHETGRAIYSLQPKQHEVFQLTPLYRHEDESYPTHIGCGGAAGGGKSYLARTIATGVALAWPGSSSIIFRGTEREVKTNHVLKFLAEVPQVIGDELLYKYNGEDMVVNWENGSKTYFGFLRNDQDVFTYLGAEYDLIVFEEDTTYSDFQVDFLSGNRLRATVPGSRPFCLHPSNPGNRGHRRYKRLFIERRYRPDEGEYPEDYAFVQMYLRDNQELVQRDPGYAKRLDRLPEPWRSWQRDGDWTAGAGTAFPQIDWKKHIVPPFPVPEYWTFFGAFDWGFNHWWSFGLYAVSEDGRLFCVGTKRGNHMPDHAIAGECRDFIAGRPVQIVVSGHDCFALARAHVAIPGPTVAEIFAAYGIYLVEADIHRVNGCRQVRARLEGLPPHDEPDLVWFDTPENRTVLSHLESCVSSERDPEDVLKPKEGDDEEGADDDYDQTRYACSHRPLKRAEADHGTFNAWSGEALAHEREKLYRRRSDSRVHTPADHSFEEFE
jgi:hypothetical protein